MLRELSLPLLAQALQKLLQARYLPVQPALVTPPIHSTEGSVQVAVRDELIGERVEQVLSGEVFKLLSVVPAGVTEPVREAAHRRTLLMPISTGTRLQSSEAHRRRLQLPSLRLCGDYMGPDTALPSVKRPSLGSVLVELAAQVQPFKNELDCRSHGSGVLTHA